MPTLLIFRHAKSSWKEGGVDDHDRPLNGRGRNAVPLMGAFMREAGLAPDLILCSSAQRARETLSLLLPFLPSECAVKIERELYLAEPGALVARLRQLGGETETAMLIGHNPGFQELALALTKSGAATERAALAEKLPTAGLIEIVLDIPSWRELGPRTGRLARFITPRSLSPNDKT